MKFLSIVHVISPPKAKNDQQSCCILSLFGPPPACTAHSVQHTSKGLFPTYIIITITHIFTTDVAFSSIHSDQQDFNTKLKCKHHKRVFLSGSDCYRATSVLELRVTVKPVCDGQLSVTSKQGHTVH